MRLNNSTCCPLSTNNAFWLNLLLPWNIFNIFQPSMLHKWLHFLSGLHTGVLSLFNWNKAQRLLSVILILIASLKQWTRGYWKQLDSNGEKE